MADNDLDDLPSLDAVMKGFSGMDDGSKTKGKDDDLDDLGFDLDDKPFSRFADEDRLENDPDRKKEKDDEIVFEVIDDDGDGEFDDEEFKDNRKNPDKRKQSRLQREMRLKAEARDGMSQLSQHLSRVAGDVTAAMRAEMHGKRDLAEVVKNHAEQNIQRFSADLKRAREDGDDQAVERIAGELAEAKNIVLKADAVIERFAKDKVEAFVYDPKVPEQLRNPNGGGTTKGRDWIDANAHWFNDPQKHAAEIGMARSLDEQLMKEGKFKPDTDEYYNELTRRMALKARDIDVYTIDGRVARVGERQRGGDRNQRRDTTGSSSQSGSHQSRRPSQSRESLSSEDQHFLKGFGLDLNNKDHLKELKANRVR